ncbi:hypothetical protein [Spiroplasma endosymbiont of Zeiraphera isertana]|uniref:hypothetical protein n=1 Tax=Spiroplasma endosymbiont of Zeiraphera isertana TaxID=3066313 RepID=UPI00313AEBB5
MLLKSKTFIHPEKQVLDFRSNLKLLFIQKNKFLLIQVIKVYKIFIKIHFCHLKKVNTIN